MDWGALLSSAALVLVAIIEAVATRERRQAKGERERSIKRAERREQESVLAMEMMDANCALSLVNAKKLMGHQTNGDVEEAMEKAMAAQANYNKFVQGLAAHEVSKI